MRRNYLSINLGHNHEITPDSRPEKPEGPGKPEIGRLAGVLTTATGLAQKA